MPITECLGRYLDLRGPALCAPRTLSFALERLVDFWDGRMVAEIGDRTCEAYRALRQSATKGRPAVKPATVDRELTVLRAAVYTVFKAGELAALPVLPKVATRSGRDYALSEEDGDRLLAAADNAAPHLRLFTYLALFTAGRAGALLELTWDQVDLGARPRVRLNPEGRQQTAKRRATVPTPRRLAAVLVQSVISPSLNG